jgi:hypothetical protein
MLTVSTIRPGVIKSVILCALLFLIVLIEGRQTVHGQAPASQQLPASATDIDVVANESGTILYLVDAETRTLYMHKVTASEPERLTLSDFQRFPAAQNFLKPTALTHSGEKLYICDQGGQAIYEVDTQATTIRKIIDQISLTQPVSIAVSGSGVIAVGDDASDTVVTFEPVKQPESSAQSYERTVAGHGYDDPDRLLFVVDNLFVLETEQGKLFLVGDRRNAQSSNEDSVNNLLAGLKSEFRTIQDLTYINGIFYVVSDGRVVAFTPVSSHKTFPAFKEDPKRTRTSHLPRIVASRDHLFMMESDGKSIIRSPRPIPVNVNFEPDSTTQPLTKTFEQQRGALISLYEYLSSKELLPRREFTTQHRYNNLKELLFEQRVLIDPDLSDGLNEGRLNSDKRIAALLCKYNSILCQDGDPLSNAVEANQKLTVPNVPIETDLTLVDVPLGKRTVREMLSKLLTAQQQQQVTAEYLLRINKSSLPSFEAEIALEDFIPTSQTGLNLKPGTLLAIENGKEHVLGDLGNCGQDLNQQIEKLRLETPNELRSWAVENLLPRRADQTDAYKLTGVDQVVINAKEWIKETVDLRTLEASIQSLKSDQRCGSLAAAMNSAGPTYVVTQSIKTSGAQYKLLKKDGSLKTLTGKEVEQANLLGQPRDGKDYSLAVDGPLYVAYKLLRVNSSKPAYQWAPVKLDEVKVGTKQDIYSITGGVWRLPATRWRLSLFVNATDVYDPNSALNRVLSVPGLSLLKEERVEKSFKKADSYVSPQSDAIKKNREELLKKIGQAPPIKRLSQVRVGIAESGSSVHMDHPDFVGVWFQKSDATDLVPVMTPASTTPPPDDLLRTFDLSDHGDHVAGIIGARGDTIPGLASGVQLFLIDTTNQETEASLEKDINDALLREVKIFNLSFTIGEEDAPQVNVSLNNLKTRMRTSSVWQDALFIAAAGNEGSDLTTLTDRAPVKWVVDVPNIIGVAATDDSNNILGSFDCGSTVPCRGSNYSHKYIQLAAPGFNIYSTASNGRYAFATGSSQAVPQVTAAAAMLKAQNVVHPSVIKARLIYTSDWSDQFDDFDSRKRKVWGGRLNLRRAVLQPDMDLLIVKNFSDVINSFTFPSNVKIKVKNDSGDCSIDDPNDSQLPCPNEISFNKILRISRQSNQLLRVFYLDGHTLRIMKDATLSGKVKCDELFELNQAANQFLTTNKCDHDIDMTEIFDYVAAAPREPILF